MDIHEIYKEAGRLHGHYCPGLAGGIRAGIEAARILEVEPHKSKSLYCIYEKAACFVDGIQYTFGTTPGNGNLMYHPTGKAVFSFYDASSCDSVRLSMKRIDKKDMSKDELIDFILTGPAEEIFDIGETRLPFPIREARSESGFCQCCGEETDSSCLVEKDGKLLCRDCAEL